MCTLKDGGWHSEPLSHTEAVEFSVCEESLPRPLSGWLIGQALCME